EKLLQGVERFEHLFNKRNPVEASLQIGQYAFQRCRSFWLAQNSVGHDGNPEPPRFFTTEERSGFQALRRKFNELIESTIVSGWPDARHERTTECDQLLARTLSRRMDLKRLH